MNTKPADGRDVISLLEQYAVLDWAKTVTRHPRIESKFGLIFEDQSSYPPYTSFRLRHENEALINAVRSAIASFDGRLEWELTSHDRAPLPGTNFSICPKILLDIANESEKAGQSPHEYVRKNMPEVGPMAHDDLHDLFNHLQSQFSANGLKRLKGREK